MIPIGTLDRITSIVGERGTGKSTLAVDDARAFKHETGGYVVGHSPNGQIGAKHDIRFHDSIKALDAGLRREPHFMHLLASGGRPEHVIDYARALSFEIRKAAHKRERVPFHPHRPPPPGLLAEPVLVIVDEGTHAANHKGTRRGARDTDALSTSEKEGLERFLTSARHEHLSLTFLIQAPTARSWVYLEQSNRFRIFRYLHEWGGNAIRASGIPQDAVLRVRELPKFQYFHFDKDAPEEAGFRRLPPP